MRARSLLGCLLVSIAVAVSPVVADDDEEDDDRAVAIAPRAALECVAARYRGEVLRLRDRDDGRVWEVRWRTPAGNVLRIRVTGPGCRFLEVEGVGQAEARILPGERR